MIRLTDAVVLAYTKLRVHKVRNGLAVGIAGILFGLLAAVIVITQGVFDSVARFSTEGLDSRSIVVLTNTGDAVFTIYDHFSDQSFVQDVETTYKQRIASKQAVAKRYSIEFDAPTEDPSPIMIDPTSKQKVISESMSSQVDVQAVTKARTQAAYKPFNPNDSLKKYHSAKVIQEIHPMQPQSGDLTYMKDGKENISGTQDTKYSMQFDAGNRPPTLQILDGSLTQPFITNRSFDPKKGEIPAVVPYSVAENLLGYKKLDGQATTQQKYDRLKAVRQRVGDITASFCYRNPTSQALLTSAINQQKEMTKNAQSKDYVKPNTIYKVPDAASCGPIAISSDTRTAAEKKAADNLVQYQKATGEYAGDPVEYKVVVRGVGISNDFAATGSAFSMDGLAEMLLSSWLGDPTTWSIPSNLLEQVPVSARPHEVFSTDKTEPVFQYGFYAPSPYLVEFGDKAEARDLLAHIGNLSGSGISQTYATPFGSSVLLIDEAKKWVATILYWVFMVVGGVAMIILAGTVGRSVAEGRRESAVFRAIGAGRFDIGAIYGGYALLLCWRILVFAVVLGGGLAIAVELLFSQSATLGARLAYAASDTNKEFHLLSLNSPYLLWIVGTIFAAGVLASIIPILLGARRNPINDMRNDT